MSGLWFFLSHVTEMVLIFRSSWLLCVSEVERSDVRMISEPMSEASLPQMTLYRISQSGKFTVDLINFNPDTKVWYSRMAMLLLFHLNKGQWMPNSKQVLREKELPREE
ncbi:hypothetical protein NPIL_555091 [Nephila pilipes]|uniref:Uncharacterized protein n=1 Tax=Nephila pilipes TaxID=299642 RepID=A0A8X6QUW6_NEPPI|nr:hypothetical protein NPIL_555091 [Nephila pilipes]